ncbi:MAG TPA: ABC transporter ATP-binding protein [Thermoanaerobaculia bacterium]|nr:ABC transporter ATP-binding protein [Thermoanaerobaculia bacterium]
MSSPAIEVDGLGVDVAGRPVLRDVTFAVSQGEVLAVAGASGSGKSTLLRAILGLVVPRSGIIRVGGRDASIGNRSTLPPEERNLAIVFQDLALWPHLTVAGNLEFVLSAKGVSRAATREPIREWLGRVGLADRSGAYPGELSGGEQQRVALARALVYEPAALLLDEPFSSLDVALKERLMRLVRELLAERRVPTLLVTHDPEEARALADRVAILEGGIVTQIGPTDRLVTEPEGSFAEAFVKRLR